MGDIKQRQIIFQQAYDIVMPLAQDHEEITYLNHAFITLVHLGYMDEAKKIKRTNHYVYIALCLCSSRTHCKPILFFIICMIEKTLEIECFFFVLLV